MRKLYLVLFFILAYTASYATTLWVTNKNDSGAGSLRNAVDISSTFDTIRFLPSLVSNGNDTIKLLTEVTTTNNLVIIGLRSANNTLYISGQGTSRIFWFFGTGATLDSLVLINGRATNGGAVYVTSASATLHVKNCILQNNVATQRGGAIHFYNGDLQLINSTFSNDSATTEGGAVYNQLCQSVLLDGSIFTNNSTNSRGGAISVVGTTVSTFDVVNSTLNSNRCGQNGGAIFYEGRYFTMSGSTLKFNTAGGTYRSIVHFFLQQSVPRISSTFTNSTIANNNGIGIASVISLNVSTSVQTEVDVSYCSIHNNTIGGIYTYASTEDDNAVSTITVSKSTIAYNGNTANGYGGIYSNAFVLNSGWTVSSNVTVTNSTIVYNQAPYSGSGIFSQGKLAASSYLGVKSCIVAQNSGVGMYSYSPTSSISSQGYNIFSDATVIGSQGTDQLGVSITSMNLKPLGLYGGTTENMMPNANSVAIDAGTPNDLSSAQNGTINGGRRDIGAAEFNNCSSPSTNITESACGSFTYNGQTYTASGTYTQIFTNVAGCDSVITLNLTITPNDNSQFTWAGRMGTANTDNGASVTTDKQGNVYSIGNFEGLIDLDPGAAAANFNSGTVPAFYISKLDADGNYVWGGMIKSNVTVYAYGIKVDTAGNMYITGQFYGSCDFNPGGGIFNLLSGAPEIFILKLSTTGAFVWAKALPYVTGNFSSNESNAIAIDDAGNIYTTGGYGATTDFDPNAGTYNLTSSGYQDIFVSKLDASGDFVWAKSMGNPTSGDVGNDITVDAAGNVYVTGHFQGTADFDPSAAVSNLTSAGSLDVFVVKLNTSGNLVWAKALGGTNTDVGWGIQCDAAGNVYTTGNFQGTADFNPGAGSITLTSAGVNDIFISKLDASGSYLWSRRMGSTLADFSTEIKLDAAGNIYTTGSFQGTVDFNPDAGVNNLTSSGGADIFLSKLDTDGVYVWAKKIGGPGDDMGYGLNIGSTGSLYVTGGFSNTVDFDPNTGIFNLISAGGKDAFIMKLGECCVPTTSTISANVCGSYTSPSGNYNWTNSGTYSDTITNLNGCDSIITINLTIRAKTTGIINQSICQGQAYLFNGVNRTATGVYLDTLLNAAGCDSIITLNLTVNSNPSASISPNTVAICNGANATLNASGGSSYAWSNSLGSNATVTVSPTVTTTYTVTITDGNGCTATASKTVTVNQVPSASIAPNTVAICNGASATLTASGGSSYAWSNSLGSNAIVTVSPGSTTTYTVTVTDANSCTATASKTVTVNQMPSASISPNAAAICSGANATLNASGGSSYAWSNSLGSNAIVTVSPGSTTTYTVTVTDGNGCTATASKTVTVNQVPSASIAPNTVAICNGASATLTASGGSGYAWSNSLGTNATVIVSPGSTTAYTVTVTDANSCTAVVSKMVTVNQVPNAAINGPSTTCSGLSATLTATGGVSYNWSNGLGSNPSITVSPNTTTIYTVSVISASNCTATATQSVSVTTTPVASINGPMQVCNGNAITLTANGGNTYQWANGQGNSASIIVSPTTTTTYTVTATIGTNCSASATQTVIVYQTAASQFSQAICSGNNYMFNGVAVAQGGVYLDTLQTINGCDSIVTLNLTVNQPLTGSFAQTICTGSSYPFNGQQLTQAGLYTDTVQHINGCDSIVTLNLTVSAALTAGISQAICAGDSYTFNGQQLTQAGIYNDTLQTAGGCDSILTLSLSVNNVLQTSLSDTICRGDIYSFNHGSLTEEGIYADTLQSVAGCDSIVTLSLIVNELPVPTITRNSDTLYTQAYSSYEWLLNGSTITGSDSTLVVTDNGDYAVIVAGANGCSDTSAVLNVTGVAIKETRFDLNVAIYPNPNTGSFTVKFDNSKPHRIYITNAAGKLVIEEVRAEQQYSFDISEQPAGVYFLHIAGKDNTRSFKISVLK